MNFEKLKLSLGKIQKELNESESQLKHISKSISENKESDIDTKIKADLDYQSYLSDFLREYHKQNKSYKQWIKNHSKAYIEMSEFYMGPELPMPHYLQSKKDIQELYTLFAIAGFLSLFGITGDTKLNI